MPLRLPVLPSDPDAPFPDPAGALREPDGLLAFGGDLSPARLLNAYRRGIFPWYSSGQPILWWSPDPRAVFRTDRVHLTRRFRRSLRDCGWTVRADTAFDAVLAACAAIPRRGQRGTWITGDMREAYADMHRLGHAHSVEVYDGERLVGGLYGMAVGRMFFGESMFSAESGASKVALASLARALHDWGWPLLDAQVDNDHLQRLGVELWPRSRFQQAIAPLVCADGPPGPWTDRFGERAARALASAAVHPSG
ncbi:leucyl/phenylalanyl-tRNA--protein transferase [Cognatilysobacter tabacisoli]|uniref:leucyl/phenylalanyl-tRNA--protein transferase n=1 Tax=Cognatilysobacter tabacisoli TaxID=2315424 RepID=UPI000E6B1297|nr:leucyl/phenylalanyl-tRNA--protein transferase [Lysobacter tabacisoli]